MKRIGALLAAAAVAACTINGRVIAPHLGGGASPSSASGASGASSPSASDQAPAPWQPTRPALFKMPRVVGMTLDEARAALAAAGGKGKVITGSAGGEDYRVPCRPDRVCTQEESSGVDRRPETDLHVRMFDPEKDLYEMPDVKGLSADAARAAVARAGFVEGVVVKADGACASGQVCSQTPAASELKNRHVDVFIHVGA